MYHKQYTLLIIYMLLHEIVYSFTTSAVDTETTKAKSAMVKLSPAAHERFSKYVLRNPRASCIFSAVSGLGGFPRNRTGLCEIFS